MIEEVVKFQLRKTDFISKGTQKIVETEPDKMEIINEEVKDVMIKQTGGSLKVKEGIGAVEENFTDIVSEIILILTLKLQQSNRGNK